MGLRLPCQLPVIVLAALLAACGGPRTPGAQAPASPSAEPTEASPLTAQDLNLYIAVKEKALQTLEDALDDVEAHGGDVVSRVQEISVAEREAARSLGVDWRRFTTVRDQVGRLFTAQRHREDERLLAAELSRARQDLEGQLQVARDQAARQFLEAQLKALRAQIEKLDEEQQRPPAPDDDTKLLEAVRAEIATIQGRQDKVARRLEALLERAAVSAPPSTPTPGKR